MLVTCKLPNYWSRVHVLPQAQVSCLFGFLHHDLDPLAHTIPLPFLQEDNYMMTIIIVNKLIILGTHYNIAKGVR